MLGQLQDVPARFFRDWLVLSVEEKRKSNFQISEDEEGGGVGQLVDEVTRAMEAAIGDRWVSLLSLHSLSILSLFSLCSLSFSHRLQQADSDEEEMAALQQWVDQRSYPSMDELRLC